MNPVRSLLSAHGIRPIKGLGQNFLVDRRAVHKLLAAADVQAEDVVLEIGPGIGTLTQELAKRAKKVIAVEKDKKMVEVLAETLAGFDNVETIHGDILKTNFQFSSLNFQYKIVSNLPYHITAPTIRKFLEAEKPDFEREKVGLQSMTLIVQKEVAQRMCAKPPDMSILAVSVQVYAAPKIVSYVKKTSFWPQPRVDSAIVQITPHPQGYPIDFPRFFTVLKAGFTHPRKQLVNNFSTALRLPRSYVEQRLRENGIDPTRRAETLSVQDWINLANDL